MKYLMRLTALSLLALFVASCASSKRMMRINPMADSGGSEANRMNMWPVAYHNSGSTSVLWPLMDFDDDGFAIRPLLTKDKSDWSLLWPLAGWNTETGRGWVVPAYFDTDRYFGIPALCHFDWKDEWGYLTPFFWHDEGAGLVPIGYANWEEEFGYLLTAYWYKGGAGLFPLTHVDWGKGRGYFGLAYWGDKTLGLFPLTHLGDRRGHILNAYWSRDSFGLLPLYHYSGEKDRHYLLLGLSSLQASDTMTQNWLFPAWYYRRDEESRLFATALGGWYKTPAKSGSWLAPVWWSESSGDTSHRLLFPLYYGSDIRDASFDVSPLFVRSRTSKSTKTWLLPSWWSMSTEGHRSRYLFPLWHDRRTRDTYVNWLMPFYYYEREGDATWISTLLGQRYASDDERRLHIYPFWWSRETGKHEFHSLMPLYWYDRRDDMKAVLTPLGGYGWRDDGELSFMNIAGPFYHHHQSSDRDHELTAVCWPLYTSWRSGSVRRRFVPGLLNARTEGDSINASTLVELARYRSDDRGTSGMLWPLLTVSSHDELSAFWQTVLAKYQNTSEGHSYWFTPLVGGSKSAGSSYSWALPFYVHSETPNEVDFDYLCWLGDYHRYDDKSSWRLWPFTSSSSEERVPDPFYYMTLHGRRQTTTGSSWWFTPLVGSVNRASEHWGRALPFAHWYTNDAVDETQAYWLAGLGGHLREATGNTTYQFPLFAHSSRANGLRAWHYANLFQSHWTEKSRQLGITPLIQYQQEPDSKQAWIFPLVNQRIDNEGRQFWTLLGLNHIGTTKRGSCFRLTPFFDYSSDQGAEDDFHWLHLISVRNYQHQKGFSLLGPIGFQVEREENRFDMRYLLFGHTWSRNYGDDSIPRPSKDWKQTAIGHSGSAFFPLYRHKKETFRVWQGKLSAAEAKTLWHWWARRKWARSAKTDKVIAVLKKHGVEVEDASEKSIEAALLRFGMANSKLRETRQFRSLVYRYDRSGGDVDSSVLFGLVRYKRQEEGDKSHFSILKYLFRRVREGDNIYRTFFPFFKWDSGKTESRFSFAWRFWNYERKNSRTHGHILFIPWGRRG